MGLVEVDLRGLLETQAKMVNATRALEGGGLVGAVQEGTLIVHRDAVINAPVDRGFLEASITPEITDRGTFAMGRVFTTLFYAGFVEFGTRFMAARRYMYRALQANADRVIAAIQAAIARIFG